ncbi:extracellular solute-binding protein [Paenibacillus psychroresistens]|uniref:Extracellular solute-binding protein n=1 Tax=Paenibacillus psychroresistens TaxID=1778678 RepID=A0A6B8RCJ8_9BACL|nr:extracellular solute-binding protein [Paenibacillus psychroresistens]QGQ94019.1 extracellular solute-binding protein [Paenibacillus psychroresistens]
MTTSQKMLRSFAILLSAIMVFTLAACGGSNSSTETNSPAATDSSTASATPAESVAPKSDIKLTMWNFKVAFDPGLKAVADAYKLKTGVSVETQLTTPDDAYRQKTTAAAAANELPDMYLYWAGAGGGAFDGRAMNWADELDKDKAWKDSFFPSAFNSIVINQGNLDGWQKDEKASQWSKERKVGESYGIPLDIGSFYTIYGNAKLIKEAGLPTTAPADMEEWLANMNTIKAKTGVPGLVFSGKTFSVYENWMANFQDYMKNGPEEYTKFMNRESKMTDPAHMQIAQFIEDVTKSGNMLPGIVGLDIDPADQAFASGKAAYNLGGTFSFASFSKMGMDPKDIISFRVPAYKGSKIPDAKVTPFPLVQVVVSDKGKNKQAAIDFVKYLTSEEGMVLYANGAFDIPAVNVKNKEALNGAISSMLSSMSTESNWYSENAGVSDKVFGPEWNKFHEMKQKIILGAATAKQAAEEFDKAAAAEKAKEKK